MIKFNFTLTDGEAEALIDTINFSINDVVNRSSMSPAESRADEIYADFLRSIKNIILAGQNGAEKCITCGGWGDPVGCPECGLTCMGG